MVFKNGKTYKVKQVAKNSTVWNEVQTAIIRRTKPGIQHAQIIELFDIKWNRKPFPYSWTKEFRPNRRFFFHGTSSRTIQSIINNGFQVGGVGCQQLNGAMLGNGIYATYHAHKGKRYAVDNYMLSVMVYAPKTLCVNAKQKISHIDIKNAINNKMHAIEVRTNAIVDNSSTPQYNGSHTMVNHEICVFEANRIIPRFIIKIK